MSYGPPTLNRLDRVLFWLCFIGLLLLCFGAGSALVYFKLPPYQWIDDANTARQAMREQSKALKEASKRKYYIKDPKTSTLIVNSKDSYQGYTLYSTPAFSKAFLIDMEGNTVHVWQKTFSEIWPHAPHVANPVPESDIFWWDAQLFPGGNGDLLITCEGPNDTPYGYGMAKIDKDSNVIWRYDANVHHRADIGDDGTIYLMTHEIASKSLFPELHIKDRKILLDKLILLTPEGKEKASISLTQALADSPYRYLLDQRWKESKTDKPRSSSSNKWDILHANSVMVLRSEMAPEFPMFKPGQVLVSMRNIDVIGVLDVSSGRFVWATKGPWSWQHNAEFASDGTILLFDNRGNKNNSRILKYHPATKKTMVIYPRSDSPPFYTFIRGAQQELPNGNILITESQKGKLLEVNTKGQMVWGYYNPYFSDKKRVPIIISRRYGYDELSFLDKKDASSAGKSVKESADTE